MSYRCFPLLALLLLFLSDLQIFAQTTEHPCQQLLNNVVKVNGGWGFIVAEQENELFVVTARHVLTQMEFSDSSDVKVRFFDSGSKHVKAVLKKVSSNLDLALVAIDNEQQFPWLKACLGSDYDRNDEVGYIGQSSEWYIPTWKTSGAIQGQSEGQIISEFNLLFEGTSGAPLVHKSGIIGLITDVDRPEVRSIDITVIRDTLVKWGIPWELILGDFPAVNAIPLPHGAKEDFQRIVTLIVRKFEEDPVNLPASEEALDSMMNMIFRNEAYEQEMPFEVAMLKRLYCAVYILNAISRSQHWDIGFRKIHSLLDDSERLFRQAVDQPENLERDYYQRIAEQLPVFYAAVDELNEIFKEFRPGQITCELAANITNKQLILSMPSSEGIYINRKARNISDLLCSIAALNKEVIFFKNARNPAAVSFEETMELVDIILHQEGYSRYGNAGEGVNPYYSKIDDGCKIEYNFIKDKTTSSYHWDLSSSKQSICPVTGEADLLMSFWERSLINLKALDILLDDSETLEEINDKAEKNASGGRLLESIYRWFKVTLKRPDWAEPHWNLAKSLFWQLQKTNADLLREVQLELLRYKSSPEKEQQKALKKIIRQYPTVSQVVLAEYPVWMLTELRKYVELAPNGQYADRARILIQESEKMMRNLEIIDLRSQYCKK